MGSMQQLFSMGPQDKHITKDPEFYHFYPKPWEQFMPFGVECIEAVAKPSFQFGNTSRIEVPKNGGYLGNIYLEMTVTDTNLEASMTSNPYGILYLMNQIKLKVGGKTIDTLTPDLIMQHHLLDTPIAKKQGTDLMFTGTVVGADSRLAYIPLPFWFSRGYTKESPKFPLYPLDLSYKIELEITWSNKLENARFSEVEGEPYPFSENVSVVTCGLMDIGYVTRDEIHDLIAKRSDELIETHEYYTERVQHKKEVKIEIPFTMSSKELIWGVRKTVCVGEDPMYPSYLFEDSNTITHCELFHGSVSLFQGGNTKAKWFQLVNPHKNGQNPTRNTGLFTHSFSLYPSLFQPSGSFNLGKGNNFLKLTFSEPFCGEIVIMSRCYNVLRLDKAYTLMFS